MKKKLIQYVSVLLSFLAGLFLTSYLTQVGNRDMTTSMAEAVLPVLYAETEGTLYNEMHDCSAGGSCAEAGAGKV